MFKYIFTFIFSSFCLLAAAISSGSEQIHFLALDLPQDTDEYIVKHSQAEIRRLIKEKAPEYSDKILYHTPDNIHISLIRFNEIPTSALLKKYINIFNQDINKLPNRNIADKIRQAKLHVTSSGFIVYVFPEPVTLTKFVNLIIKDLKKNKLYYKDSDFQEGGKIYPHFSIAYFNPKEVSVKTMREILDGRISAPECNSFVINEFCLKHSEKNTKPLTYSTVCSFKQ